MLRVSLYMHELFESFLSATETTMYGKVGWGARNANLLHRLGAFFYHFGLQGYLAHQKMPTPLGPPRDPTHRPTVGS